MADGRSTVLVTGATGFIGSYLVERLVALGFHVRCLVRRTSSLSYLPSGDVELAYGELRTGAGLREAVAGARAIFHLAGVTKALSAADYYTGNVQATANLLRAIIESGAEPERFVHVSSLAAIGPSSDGVPLREDAPPRPLTHYGKSKLAGEEAVRKSPLCPRAVIVRPAVVYGPRDTDVLEFFKSVRRGLIARIAREEAFVSIIHVADLVEALIAASNGPARGGAYFAANPEAVSWNELGTTAAEIMGQRARAVRIPPPVAYAVGFLSEIKSRVRGKPAILSRDKITDARQRFWVCDTTRARDELGFRARIPLRDGIAGTLEWYRKSGWLRF